MPIILCRVDERLIHGQVVIGWGSQLHPSLYVVVDDEIADSSWEQDLYLIGLPKRTAAEFRTVEETVRRIDEWRGSGERIVILLRDLDTAVRLARSGALAGLRLNLGGIHHRPGREEILSYVYLDERDRECLKELDLLGVPISARDLPGSPEVPLEDLLRED